MDGAIEARIVDIGVPLADNSYNYFTGYILSDGLILTCLHGFTDEPDYDSSSDITISSSSPSSFDITLPLNSACFDELVEEDGFFQYYCPEFSEKFDVVIFSCPDAKATNPQSLQLARFNDPGKWKAGGFPYFNRANGATDGYKNFNGTFTTPGSVTNLELKVLQPELPNMKDWGGASGGPVFIDRKLAGIIRCYTKYEGANGEEIIPNQLEASYLKKLWEEDPKFKVFFEFQDAADKVTKHVERFLDTAEGRYITAVLEADSSIDLVERLKNKHLSGFLDEMETIESKSDLAARKKFTNSFVPFFFCDQALLVKQLSSSVVVDIGCVKEYGAEFVMSAFSGREANVAYEGDALNSDGKLYVTQGKQALAAMPESGIGNVELETSTIASDFLNRKALPDIITGQSRLSINKVSVEGYLISRFAGDIASEGEKAAIRQVNRILENRARKNQYFYMLVKIDKSSDAGKAALVHIARYKETFPNLIFINLAPSGHMDERELLLHAQLPTLITE